MPVDRPAITNEQREALLQSGGSPIQLEDPETRQVYLLVEQPVEPQLEEAYIRAALQVALDEFDAGQEEKWDIEAVIAQAKREFAERQ